MKRTVLLALTAIMLFSCNDQSKLAGEWLTDDNYSSEKIIFKEDGGIIVLKNNKIDDMGIKGVSMSYDLDNSKTPHHIDFVFSESESKEEALRIKGIYEMLSDNTMRICFNDFGDDTQSFIRPKEFSTRNTKIFTRNK